VGTLKLVMKFGGSSLADGRGIRRVAEIIKRYSSEHTCIVVVSALMGVTDRLIGLMALAQEGDKKGVDLGMKELIIKHEDAVKEAMIDREKLIDALDSVQPSFEELGRLLNAMTVLREGTPRTKDRILSFGEALSCLLLYHTLSDMGVKAQSFMGGDAGIVTDENFGEASPLMEVTRMKTSTNLTPLLNTGITPVVAGFTGVTQHGDVTTLGRGGSDYTATILGFSLDVDEVWIWSDVDGIMTCDPKLVSSAKLIPELSFAEALEMATFGIKQFHPRALEPSIRASIPLRIRNTFNESNPGTLISGAPKAGHGIVKAVALVKDVGMITVSGAGMAGRPGTAARVFDVLGRENVNVLMISQSASEASITFLVRKNALYKAVSDLEIALLGRGVIDNVAFEDDVSIVAAIGAGMKGTPGVAAKIFQAVAKKGVNIRMIAQGSSELNISFVVAQEDGQAAVQAIHEAFNL